MGMPCYRCGQDISPARMRLIDRIDELERDLAIARGELKPEKEEENGAAWQPIDTAPRSTRIEVKTLRGLIRKTSISHNMKYENGVITCGAGKAVAWRELS